MSDFQAVQKMLKNLLISEDLHADGHTLSTSQLYGYLSRVMYNRRSKIDPLWNSFVVGGIDKLKPDGTGGEPFLAYVDLLGTTYSAPSIATGYGGYIAQPLLRRVLDDRQGGFETLSEDEAKSIIETCMKVLFYRDARSLNKVRMPHSHLGRGACADFDDSTKSPSSPPEASRSPDRSRHRPNGALPKRCEGEVSKPQTRTTGELTRLIQLWRSDAVGGDPSGPEQCILIHPLCFSLSRVRPDRAPALSVARLHAPHEPAQQPASFLRQCRQTSPRPRVRRQSQAPLPSAGLARVSFVLPSGLPPPKPTHPVMSPGQRVGRPAPRHVFLARRNGPAMANDPRQRTSSHVTPCDADKAALPYSRPLRGLTAIALDDATRTHAGRVKALFGPFFRTSRAPPFCRRGCLRIFGSRSKGPILCAVDVASGSGLAGVHPGPASLFALAKAQPAVSAAGGSAGGPMAAKASIEGSGRAAVDEPG